jgi:RHS repeat-associated protein
MAVTNYYSVNGEIIAEHTAGQSRLDYVTDGLGSVVTTVDQTLTVQSTARYKPYGSELATTGAPMKFGWVGSEGYRGTGLPHSDCYVWKRHNSTVEGRWTTVDPLWPQELAYGYAFSNSTTVIDPSGLAGCLRPRCNTSNPCLSGSGHPGPGHDGETFCCNGKAVTCVNLTIPGRSNPFPPSGLQGCVQLHENYHQTHLDCVGRPDFYSPKSPCQECVAYGIALNCYKKVSCSTGSSPSAKYCLSEKWRLICVACSELKSNCASCGTPPDPDALNFCNSISVQVGCKHPPKP